MLRILRHEISYVVSLMISVEILNDKLLTIFGQIPIKAFWSYARSRMKMCVTIGSVEGIDGQLHHSDYQSYYNAFNEFFSSVFMDENPDTVPIFTTGRGDLGSLSSINVTPDLVFDKLNSLKPGKTSGSDGWPPTVLKRLATQLCVPLQLLYYLQNP